MQNLDLIGLELSHAEAKLSGEKFKLVYYTSDKQKIFDKELVIRVKRDPEGLVLTVGRFLFKPEE
ncbi:MAG: hypothetical protein PHI78_03035 [Clostridia bacterium]|nr:hypothetical protein [Clostridia bacterium]